MLGQSVPAALALAASKCRLRIALVYAIGAVLANASLPAADLLTGKDIYQKRCAECHGEQGEGVADEHDEPLYGDRSLAELTKIIAETMPKDDPDKCTGECAEKVAAFIYQTFYTADARARNKPPRIELAHLTVRQYGTSVSDLVGSFRDGEKLDEKRRPER